MKDLESAFVNIANVCVGAKLSYPEHLQIQEDLKLIKEKLFPPSQEEKVKELKKLVTE